MKSLDNILYNTPDSDQEPEVGSLLIAQPYLDDKPFKHAVVLLTELDSNDAFSGFVMNKQSQYTLSDFLDISEERCNMPLYCGGPVSTDHLFFIHTLHNIVPGGINITDDLYLGGDFEKLISYINSGFELHNKVRFFLGYSGWGSHQLSEEIKEHFWAVSQRYDPANLFMEGEDSYWHSHVRLMGSRFKNWLYHPLNPQSN